jgi:hypothetical protein
LRLGRLVHAGQTISGSGAITGDPPVSQWCGIRHTALDSPLRRIPKLAQEDWETTQRLEKTGDIEPRKRYVHGERVEVYRDATAQGGELGENELAIKSSQSPYRLGEFRPNQTVLTAAIDVQWRRLYWMVCATDPQSLTTDIVHHGMLPLCLDGQNATRDQIIAGLTNCATTVHSVLPEGAQLSAAGVDTSDGTTSEAVFAWLAGNPDWYAIRGKAEKSLGKTNVKTTPLHSVPAIISCHHSVDHSGTYTVAIIHVDNVKGDIMRSLPKLATEAGAVNIPQEEAATGRLIREMTAERLTPTPTGLKWVRRRTDNHRLDLAVYNRALSRLAIDCLGAGSSTAKAAKGGNQFAFFGY